MNLPKLYGLGLGSSDILDTVGSVKWLLLSVLSMLAIGFALLYRKGSPEAAVEAAPDAAAGKKAGKNARGRS